MPKLRPTAFSLVEISIVLTITGIALAGFLPMLTQQTKSKAVETTQKRLEAIEHALSSYVLAEKKLPCPSDNSLDISTPNFARAAPFDGIDCQNGTSPDANFVTATGTSIGGVPTKTLGLPDEYGFDGWQRRFTYHVSHTNLVPNGIFLPGLLTVTDRSGIPYLNNAVFAVISHGANGHGGWLLSGKRAKHKQAVSTAEKENCDCDDNAAATLANGTIIQSMPLTNVADSFDDMVLFRRSEHIQLTTGLAAEAKSAQLCTNEASDGDGLDDVTACVNAASNGGNGNASHRALSCEFLITTNLTKLSFLAGKWQLYGGVIPCKDGTTMVMKLD